MNIAQGIFLACLVIAFGVAVGWLIQERSPKKKTGWPTKHRPRSGRANSRAKSSDESSSALSVSLAAAGAAAVAKREGNSDLSAAAAIKTDDLTRIKGIGPKLQERCRSVSISRFEQIAAWSEIDVAEFEQSLKLSGRISRDRWVDQAKLLAAGDDAAHKAEFG